MKFDDDNYVSEFLRNGTYPKIHDDIFYLASQVRGHNVLDLGCCKGLLSKRLSAINPLVVGIDASKAYIDKAVKGDNIKYVNTKVTEDTLPAIKGIIQEHGITVLVARRVIPELCETGGMQLCTKFAKLLQECGVEHIVLEGRKKCANPTNPLSSIDMELKVFEPYYNVIKAHKDCRLLKLK